MKGEEIQPLASSRMQCPERRLAWAPAWGQRLLLVWESERRVRVFLGAGSRSLLRWAAPPQSWKKRPGTLKKLPQISGLGFLAG